MDALDIEFVAGATFILTRNLSAWAALYPDINTAVFRAHMRVTPSDPTIYYAWASDATARGTLTFAQTYASGSFAFTANPSPGDQLQFGSTIVQFVASGASGTECNIGATLEGTLANLVTMLTASSDSQLVKCSYDQAGLSLIVTFKTGGLTGNDFDIAVLVGSVEAASAPTLMGGGGQLLMQTPAPTDTAGFAGEAFVYDCRMELDAEIIYLFGGTITFLEPVTRT